MRDKIWLLLNETEEGGVGVQAFESDPMDSFENMNGTVGDPPSRATLVQFDFVNRQVQAMSKDLPLKREKPEDRPDGWRLGEGPVYFDKDEKHEGKDGQEASE